MLTTTMMQGSKHAMVQPIRHFNVNTDEILTQLDNNEAHMGACSVRAIKLWPCKIQQQHTCSSQEVYRSGVSHTRHQPNRLLDSVQESGCKLVAINTPAGYSNKPKISHFNEP
jgi:hypothetical protein